MSDATQPPSPRHLFERAVPSTLIDVSIAAVLRAWDSAHERGEEFLDEERRDVHGHLRRALMEGAWRLAARSIEGVTATVGSTSGETFNYTEVRVGRVVLTQSAVNACSEKPRDARFRDFIAWNVQPSLFDLFAPPPPVVEGGPDAVYAILLHGPRRSRDKKPTFIGIGFPSRDLTRFIDHIDLTERMHVIAAELAAERNKAAPIAEPNPRLAAEETVADEDLLLKIKGA